MVVLLTCKNETVPIKNEGARVLTRLYVVFSDPQEQLTMLSVVKLPQNRTRPSFYGCPCYLQE